MPQYLLSVSHPADFDPSSVAEEDMQRMFAQVGAFNDELRSSGSWVFAGGLMPVSDATCVDATGPEPVVTDGPFVEAKEYLGGFWVIEAADLDAALAIATTGSAACEGKVEVRPFQGV
jgi:hypothetical protein